MSRVTRFALSLLLLCAANSQAQAVTAVIDFDLNRYTGEWFEIARFPNKFQKQCSSEVTATYVMRADGKIDVINRCRNAVGNMEEVVGRAYAPNPEVMGKLKVRFAPEWLSWLPAVWADYWIVDIAPDYSVVAVGDPTKKYLWILSRNTGIDAAIFNALKKRLAAQGYDPNKLVPTRQTVQ